MRIYHPLAFEFLLWAHSTRGWTVKYRTSRIMAGASKHVTLDTNIALFALRNVRFATIDMSALRAGPLAAPGQPRCVRTTERYFVNPTTGPMPSRT